ncbi:hypothetical protein EB796_013959 [Bugula neritina]|uniref:Sulfotransferase domain-containing protein n=1 Tax=Bugula neritina TaxID=10212 RepID=A0A7J7JQL9_BUGNE|nr:hypothetical protein EB796_013959 [Bugula neritina]
MGDMFLTSSGGLNFEDCPNIQLADSTTEFYSNSYSADSIASGAQQRHFYTHCEHCLTTAFTDRYFGTLFLDLPTAMFQYIETNEQKFIITMKNPTDRVISEYFYPFIQKGADLSAVGGDVMHSAMSDAIDEAKQCMTDNGPTLCVYGEVAPSLSETTALYESCYYTYLEHITQQIPLSKIYFVKIEEFHASPESQIALLNKFVGLSATSRSPGRKVGHVHKPFLSETVTMLDAFFAPFNSKLSSLLSDSKWLYQRT